MNKTNVNYRPTGTHNQKFNDPSNVIIAFKGLCHEIVPYMH